MIARARDLLRALPRVESAILLAAVVVLVGINVAKDRRGEGLRFDSYSTYDTAAGGYRAFYELLAREGIRVSRFTGRPAFLDASVDTLIWAEPLPFDPAQRETTRADVSALEAWVRAGGHLVYLGHDELAAASGLLHLPRSRPRERKRHAKDIDPELRAAGVGAVVSSAALRWRAGKNRTYVLMDDGLGPLAVRYAFGRGTVVALIDESLFTNAAIAANDRARLAAVLARPLRAGGTLTFDEAVHGYATPLHWWSVVPRAFVIALALAVATLLVAFAGAAIRLGPPIVPALRDDRSSADFIDALARLLERGHAVRGALVEALRSTSRVVARSLGLRDELSHEEIAAHIERDDVRAAFRELVAVANNGYPNDTNLVRGAALAQRLWKEFAAHDRQ